MVDLFLVLVTVFEDRKGTFDVLAHRKGWSLPRVESLCEFFRDVPGLEDLSVVCR